MVFKLSNLIFALMILSRKNLYHRNWDRMLELLIFLVVNSNAVEQSSGNRLSFFMQGDYENSRAYRHAHLHHLLKVLRLKMIFFSLFIVYNPRSKSVIFYFFKTELILSLIQSLRDCLRNII